MGDSFFSAAQIKTNAATQANWAFFTEHRERITKLLRPPPREANSLCVLGAGNINDLALPDLLTLYPHITLVDIDIAAMRGGMKRQFPGDQPAGIQLQEADVTGCVDIFDSIKSASSETAREALLSQLQERFLQPPQADFEPKRHSLVVSACLLSQLVGMVVQAIGERHTRFVPLMQAIRAQHFKMLYQWTAPGGELILITDFVSSLTAPEILYTVPAQLPGLARRLVQQANFFTGLNPAILQQQLANPEVLGGPIENLKMTDVWRWNLGPRVYLVVALRGRKPC